MRIAFDFRACEFIDGQFHGGQSYSITILNQLINLARNESIDLSLYLIKNKGSDYPRAEITNLTDSFISFHEVNDKEEIYKFLAKYDIDKFYSPLPYDLDVSRIEVDTILTVHGMRGTHISDGSAQKKLYLWKKIIRSIKRRLSNLRFLIAPINLKGKLGFLENLQKSEKSNLTIIVPSQYTRMAIERSYASLSDKVEVLYSPPSETQLKISQGKFLPNTEHIPLPERYILALNVGREEKNAISAIKAFINIQIDIEHNMKFVLVGKLNPQIKTMLSIYNDLFIHFESLNNDDFVFVLKNADMLVYPSLSEGFGYPPIEAMEAGLRVIGSCNTSLAEICSGGMLYINPNNIADLENKLLSAIKSDSIFANIDAIAVGARVRKRQEKDLEKLTNLILRP